MEKLNFSPAFESEEEPEKVFLGQTKDGFKVYDREDSHFHAEGGLTPEILESAINVIDTEGEKFVKKQINFNQPIGKQSCVEVGPEDEIVMVYRKGRSGRTPMVKNREMEPCSSLTIILKKDQSDEIDDTYKMITAFIGGDSTREPWDPNVENEEEYHACEDFWSSHALVYDENLIDFERTMAFEQMSEQDRKEELIRQRTLYNGLFVNPEELYQKVPPTLENPIKYPHVTFNFKPDTSELRLSELGSGTKIRAIGYGNDGKNEGLLVEVETDDPVIKQAYEALETPHITLSVSEDGQAKDTINLEFKPLETPIEIAGKYGLFLQGTVAQDIGQLV